MPRERILVVEDEPAISDAVVYALETDGYEAAVASTGESALSLVRSTDFALVLLDIGLPDVTGWELGKSFISKGIPVVFLTSRQSEIDRVAGLEMGGDDYVVKPFSPRELVARVRAVLRRNERKSEESARVRVPGIQFDRERCRALLNGRDLGLSRNEYRLLEVLASKPGRVFNREELLAKAWDEPEGSQDRTVDAHIKQLRAKIRLIEPEFDPIETRRGFGYSMRIVE